MAEAPNSPGVGAIPSMPAGNTLPQGIDAVPTTPAPATKTDMAAGDARVNIVVDLSGMDTAGANFELVEARLVLRFADGQEQTLAEFPLEETAYLRLADGGTIEIEVLAEALVAADGPLPVLTAIAELAEAAPEAGTEAVSSGAEFRPMQINDPGATPDPTMQLDAVEDGRTLGRTSEFFTRGAALDGSGPFGGAGAGGSAGAGGLGSGPNGGRFINNRSIARDDNATTNEKDAVLIELLANDSDNDPQDAPCIIGLDDAGLVGRVTLNDDGTVLYETNGQFDHLGKGDTNPTNY